MSSEDRLHGVVVAVSLEGRLERILQVSSIPVRGRAVNPRRLEGRFCILSGGAGREGKFGGGGYCPYKGVASIWNLPYEMYTFANLQEYGILPEMGDKRGVVVTVVVEEG